MVTAESSMLTEALVGYNDVVMAAWQSYRLTTVSRSLPRTADRAVEFLLDRIAAPELPVRIERPTGELVGRAISGAAS
jgi:DNA-binding LacI/PurR family transcriptional regulator